MVLKAAAMTTQVDLKWSRLSLKLNQIWRHPPEGNLIKLMSSIGHVVRRRRRRVGSLRLIRVD